MLILSRRPGQEIVFPNLNVKVRLVRTEGNTARLAIEAPRDIAVFRSELLQGEAAPAPPAPPTSRAATHELCNRLSKATLSLHLFEKLWQAGRNEEAAAALDAVLTALQGMDRDWVARTIGAPVAKQTRCRALVVDDDQNERELLAGLLSMNGCDCRTAFDGQDALEHLAANERPDYVLLDMWMPRCDGKQTLEAIRAEPRLAGVKVISISPTTPEEMGIARGPAGVDAWFPKPLDPRKLWDVMQKGLADGAN